MEEETKSYKNDDITVYWKPSLCIHSAICTKGLPNVFDVKKRPWINIKGAANDEIIEIVNKCPSGALSYAYNNKNETQKQEINQNKEINITLIKDGPIIIGSDCKIIDVNGNVHHRKSNCAICVCGLSKEKPFCDGSHYQKII